MNLAMLQIGYNKVKRILQSSNLYYEENNSRDLNFTMSKFSKEFIMASRDKKEDYQNIYQIAINNKDYDFLFNDYSFLQLSGDFDSGENNYRYAYYEVPTSFPSYDEYIEDCGFSYEDCGEEFRTEYEQIVDEANLKRTVMPIRYDYDSRYYNPPIHSISHFHFGIKNQIRLPVNKLVTPQAFVAFIIRHIYWDKWKILIEDTNFHSTYYVKNTCYDLKPEQFSIEEINDFYLS